MAIKKIVLFVLVLVLLFSLMACNAEEKIISQWEYAGQIDIVGDVNLGVYYDKNTKVMYAARATNGWSTVLFNADGTPMLYEGEDNA